MFITLLENQKKTATSSYKPTGDYQPSADGIHKPSAKEKGKDKVGEDEMDSAIPSGKGGDLTIPTNVEVVSEHTPTHEIRPVPGPAPLLQQENTLTPPPQTNIPIVSIPDSPLYCPSPILLEPTVGDSLLNGEDEPSKHSESDPMEEDPLHVNDYSETEPCEDLDPADQDNADYDMSVYLGIDRPCESYSPPGMFDDDLRVLQEELDESDRLREELEAYENALADPLQNNLFDLPQVNFDLPSPDPLYEQDPLGDGQDPPPQPVMPSAPNQPSLRRSARISNCGTVRRYGGPTHKYTKERGEGSGAGQAELLQSLQAEIL